jgi:hypothetical protein
MNRLKNRRTNLVDDIDKKLSWDRVLTDLSSHKLPGSLVQGCCLRSPYILQRMNIDGHAILSILSADYR